MFATHTWDVLMRELLRPLGNHQEITDNGDQITMGSAHRNVQPSKPINGPSAV